LFHEDIFFDYLTSEKRFSSHTLIAYQQDLTNFIQFCKENQCLTSVSEVRHLHIRSWIVYLMEGKMAARSVNRKLSCLKSFFKYLRKKALLDKDPMQKVVGPKTGKRLPVFIQETHMALLFSEIEFDNDYRGQLDRLVLEILYATGMRRSELVNLTLGDLDFSRGYFKVLGKGGKERIVPFATMLNDLLEKFIAIRHETFPMSTEKWLLLDKKGEQLPSQTVYTIVKKYLSLVSNAEQRSPHVLRHSFATHLSDHGADLNAIKELLGHSNLAATQIYMHNSMEKLKKVYEQAHPRSQEIDEIAQRPPQSPNQTTLSAQELEAKASGFALKTNPIPKI
jgi:integrase/recombinase XerC